MASPRRVPAPAGFVPGHGPVTAHAADRGRRRTARPSSRCAEPSGAFHPGDHVTLFEPHPLHRDSGVGLVPDRTGRYPSGAQDRSHAPPVTASVGIATSDGSSSGSRPRIAGAGGAGGDPAERRDANPSAAAVESHRVRSQRRRPSNADPPMTRHRVDATAITRDSSMVDAPVTRSGDNYLDTHRCRGVDGR